MNERIRRDNRQFWLTILIGVPIIFLIEFILKTEVGKWLAIIALASFVCRLIWVWFTA